MVVTQLIRLRTDEMRQAIPRLHAADQILLSGTVYTARDAAHKRLWAQLENGEPLPFDLRDSVIYYCGSTPAPDGAPIGSCGPTTSGRMDPYAPRLYDLGVCATVGKGVRSPEVVESIRRNQGIYLCAIGGAGALAAGHVRECCVIAYPELGCEAIKRLEIEDFPLFVGEDCHGGSLFRPSNTD